MSIFDERPDECAIERRMSSMAPRSGIRRGTRQPLTQDQTNAAIRFELWLRMEPADRALMVKFLGYQPSSWILQTGGIDEDEIVRLFAYRMWGRRDVGHGIRSVCWSPFEWEIDTRRNGYVGWRTATLVVSRCAAIPAFPEAIPMAYGDLNGDHDDRVDDIAYSMGARYRRPYDYSPPAYGDLALDRNGDLVPGARRRMHNLLLHGVHFEEMIIDDPHATYYIGSARCATTSPAT